MATVCTAESEFLTPVRLRVGAAWVDCVDSAQVMAFVRERLRRKLGGVIAAVNPEKCIASGESGELRAFLKGADLLIPDGIGVVLYAWTRRHFKVRRVAGCDLALSICREAFSQGSHIFLLGASEQVSIQAADYLAQNVGRDLVAGRANGYEDVQDVSALVRIVEESGAEVLLVALGSPRQELLIQRVRVLCPGLLILGVGGTFDVWAGGVERAPEVLQRIGLEWAFRLAKQPSRWRRQLRLFRFLPLIAGRSN